MTDKEILQVLDENPNRDLKAIAEMLGLSVRVVGSAQHGRHKEHMAVHGPKTYWDKFGYLGSNTDSKL